MVLQSGEVKEDVYVSVMLHSRLEVEGWSELCSYDVSQKLDLMHAQPQHAS